MFWGSPTFHRLLVQCQASMEESSFLKHSKCDVEGGPWAKDCGTGVAGDGVLSWLAS